MKEDPQLVAEIAKHLTRIQQLCREYVSQGEGPRKMTFASIRESAETISTLAFDGLPDTVATAVQEEVNRITASLDDLGNRFGTDEPTRCRVCAKPLTEVAVGGGQTLVYCVICPSEMLDAIRNISDATGADVL